ncbi:sigma factor [Kribbella sp. CA-247076]|uniref:sigma factor n=1 Tax=Kribbella sp. CA-247076 TaxID=3239941 RepID=UPI003D93D1F5
MASTADESWLRDAFEEHRRPLHTHCYRLTGNVADADDLVQETFLRGWRSRRSTRAAPRSGPGCTG